jgi:beta-glucosidase
VLRAVGPNTDAYSPLIQRLKQRGIPVVTVFLSGRPRGVSEAIAASTAFVAAWLPGSEGEGLADVLFRTPSGAIQSDFSGTLTFDWPHTSPAAGTPSAPIPAEFPYGFGLSYDNHHH